MLTLKLMLFPLLLAIIENSFAVEDKPIFFDGPNFKIEISYSDPHSKSYQISGNLDRIGSQKDYEYNALLADSRYENGKAKKTNPVVLLALALQLQHYENIFEHSFSVGEIPPSCLGMAVVKIQIGKKRKDFKMCPNDPAPNKNFLRVMNWLVYLKKIGQDQFSGANQVP